MKRRSVSVGRSALRKSRNLTNRCCRLESLERREMFSVGMSAPLVAGASASVCTYADVATASGITKVTEKTDLPGAAATAKAITLPAVISGKIKVAGDQDWLKFTATKGNVIGTVAGSGVACDVFNAALRPVGSLDGRPVSINVGQVYYLRIRGTAPGVGNLSYEIAVQHPANAKIVNAVKTVAEPADISNNFVEAKSINLGAVVRGKIDTASDVEWLIFRATGNTVVGTVAGSGVACEVLDRKLKQVGSLGSSVINVTAGDLYYLRIHGTAPGVSGQSYEVAVQDPTAAVVSNPVRNVTESTDISNNFVEARSIVLGGVVNGKIGSASDADWLVFKATSNKIVGTLTGSGVRCVVLDRNLRQAGTIGSGTLAVTAGEIYYLRVTSTAPGVGNLSYKLSVGDGAKAASLWYDSKTHAAALLDFLN